MHSLNLVVKKNLERSLNNVSEMCIFIETIWTVTLAVVLVFVHENLTCCLPSTSPAPTIAHTGTTLNLLLCNNTHIHSPQTANCFSHSPPRPAFVLSHLQNKLCWKFHYKLPCVCQIPPGAEEIKTLDLPAPTETDMSLPHTQKIAGLYFGL